MFKRWILLGLLLSGCAAHAPSPLPSSSSGWSEPRQLLVWVGRGHAERWEGGAWRHAPAHDYDFQVVQRRYDGRWESVKTMHRRDPAYDGSAGPRDQTLYFRLDLRGAGAGVDLAVRSTLGEGAGRSDLAFREATLTTHADVSPLAPFDTYRITQHYRYEAGRLEELVELVDHADAREVPYVRVREEAVLLAPRTFDAPPTVFAAR